MAAPAAATSTVNTMPLSAVASAPVMQAVAAVLPGLAVEAAPRARPAPPVLVWAMAAPKAASKPVSFPGSPAASRPASTSPKHYEVGDIVEHKVFGRGRVLAVKAAAGDQIVEINFEKVGVKKTMANFAPLTKITEE